MQEYWGSNTNRKSIKDLIQKFDTGANLNSIPINKVNEQQEEQEEAKVLNENDIDYEVSKEDYNSEEESQETSEFLNIPGITDEIQSLLRNEEIYCLVLEDLTENYVEQLSSDKFNVHEILGRIDLISSYHNNTFLPDLRKSRNVIKIADCFVKHKTLFNTYYENYFKNLQNMIFVMAENQDIFKPSHLVMDYDKYKNYLIKNTKEHIQTYKTFLEEIVILLYEQTDLENFKRALKIISSVIKNFSKIEENVRFVISETVETERLYVEKLQHIIEVIIPKIKKVVKPISKHICIIGNVPEIYKHQLVFYDDLSKCLFNFDPNEVGECFLQHEITFKMYIKDHQLKNDPKAIEDCKELLKKINERNMDFYAPLNRLYKYKLLIKELIKISEKGELSCKKLERAFLMIGDIISEINGIVAVNLIKDENIYLNEQGKLLDREEFVVKQEFSDSLYPASYNAMVFLFEKSVVFTEKTLEGGANNRMDVYIYRSHIIRKNLKVVDYSNDTIAIYLNGRKKTWYHTLRAKNKITKNFWLKVLQEILYNRQYDE